MNFSIATSFVSFLIFSLTSAFEEIKAKSGDDVTLQCQSPRGEAVTLLEWSRPELKSDGYVYFYRNGRSYENYQHPSFHGRVQLRDPEMKDGDTSMILKNVNINDTGTYECRTIISNTEGREGDITETKNIIQLNVAWDEGDKDGGGKDGGGKDGGGKDEGGKDGGGKDGGGKDGGDKDGGGKDGGDKDGGKKDGHSGMVVGLSVTAVVLLLLLGIFSFIYNRKRKEAMRRNSYQPPPETGSVPLQA